MLLRLGAGQWRPGIQGIKILKEVMAEEDKIGFLQPLQRLTQLGLANCWPDLNASAIMSFQNDFGMSTTTTSLQRTSVSQLDKIKGC